MPPRFIQVHTLTSYPASLLNRDDAGFAKRMPFGGAIRTRISSQCQKRHWRVYDGDNSLASIDAPKSIRSRESFERYIVDPLMSAGTDGIVARAAARQIAGNVLGSDAKKEKAEKKSGKKNDAKATPQKDEAVATPQVTVLGKPELDYLLSLAREAVADGRDAPAAEKWLETRLKDDKALRQNLRALYPGSLGAGLGAALFGRMVTGDVLARTDAAIHVAHAVTVHAQLSESDYFSAIDDLVREAGEQRSGHINATELTSGIFYGYVVIDVDGLVSNVGGDRTLAADVTDRLIRIMSTVSPGAKKGSTAPYSYSHLVLVEAGRAQPRTLQNAFIDPVRMKDDVIAASYRALSSHLAELDVMYGRSESRAHAGLRTNGAFENGMPLPALAEWAREQVLA